MSSTDSGAPPLTGGALVFAAIMGVAVVVCIAAAIYSCLSQREKARRQLEDAIELDTYYGDQNITSISSPPPPPLTSIAPMSNTTKNRTIEVKADDPDGNVSGTV